MANLDHVAFLTTDINAAMAELAKIGIDAEEPRVFPGEGTIESYAGRVLLMQASGSGPYAEALAKRGPGLHHVALAVEDLDDFVRDRVEGSGWLMHPRSMFSREHGTIWLARPGVEALIEVCESEAVRAGELDHVVIAGLDSQPNLGRIFDGLDVRDGSQSGVAIKGKFMGSYFAGSP